MGALGGSLQLVGGPCGRRRKHANTACEKNSEMHYAQRLKRISGKTATAEHHWQIDFGTSSGRLFPTVAPWKISARKIKRRAPGGSLGPKTEKHQKTVRGKRAKCITHKGSNAFPEIATIAEHHWQIDFGRGSGEAISYRSALEDFGQKNKEESRKGSSAL